jgi:anti-anti-sigma regulatory factor
MSPPLTDQQPPDRAASDELRPSQEAAHLAVTVTRRGSNAIVHAVGVLDGRGGALLHSMAKDLAQAGYRQVELDLTAVASADLPGVRALWDVRVTLEDAGAELLIGEVNSTAYPIDWHAIPRADHREGCTAEAGGHCAAS